MFPVILWLLRMIALIVASVIIVLLVGTVVPQLEASHIRADVVAARIAYNGGFYDELGVVSVELFGDLSERIISPDDYLAYDKKTHVPVAVQVQLYDMETGVFYGPPDNSEAYTVVYNQEAYNKLHTFRQGAFSRDSIGFHHRSFPVTVRLVDDSLRQGVLVVEVLYGS